MTSDEMAELADKARAIYENCRCGLIVHDYPREASMPQYTTPKETP
jgi:hypothetical protein